MGSFLHVSYLTGEDVTTHVILLLDVNEGKKIKVIAIVTKTRIKSDVKSGSSSVEIDINRC